MRDRACEFCRVRESCPFSSLTTSPGATTLPNPKTNLMSLPFLNRDAYLVKPKRKFAEWMRFVDETSTPEIEESLLSGCGTIYLLEELGSGSSTEAREELNGHWREIAASEFEAWWTNEPDWPKLTSIVDFEKYFEWTYVDMIHDLSTTSLLRE